MRKFPHKPKPSLLQELFNEKRAKHDADVTGMSDLLQETRLPFLEYAWLDAISLAALVYAVEDDTATVKRYWATSSQFANRIIDLGGPTGPNYFRLHLAMANITANETLRHRLEKFERSAWVNPNVVMDELDFLSAEIMADLSAGRDETAKERLGIAATRTRDKSLRSQVKEFFVPMVHIESAIVRGSVKSLDKALQEEVELHARRHSPTARKYIPTALIDYIAMGLIKIGQRYGMRSSTQSVYLPREFL